ncbi:MAG: hypothetical protein EXS63_04775 [Candidatus Omnitrophica bacterium]|nr:hypothetical protein [Candidatus Omnitrophota bacterium]
MKWTKLIPSVLSVVLLLPYPLSYSQELSTHANNPLMELSNNPVLDPTGNSVTGTSSSSMPDLEDHKAEVFFVKGDVKVMKKGSEAWSLAEKGIPIEEGDQILTGAGGYLEVAYDKHFLDIARIGEKTHAQFLTIEPTNVMLQDGTLFSALDGLPKGSSYKVTTPTAVAAVRGTHFDVSFSAATGEFFAATIPVANDGHESIIEVTNLKLDGTEGPKAELREGIQVTLGRDQTVSPEMLKSVDPAVVNRAQENFNSLAEKVPGFNQLREEGKALMPAMMEASSTEQKRAIGNQDPAARGKDDDRKPVNGPNDGGDLGGGPHFGEGNGLAGQGLLSKDMLPDRMIDDALGNRVDPLIPKPPPMEGGGHITGFFDPNKQLPLKAPEGFMPPVGVDPNQTKPDPSAFVNFQDPLRNLPPLNSGVNQREFLNGVIQQQQNQLRQEINQQEIKSALVMPPPQNQGNLPPLPPQQQPPPPPEDQQE